MTSAVRITDPEEIAHRLFKSHEELKEASLSEQNNPSTLLRESSDGRLEVVKTLPNLKAVKALPDAATLQRMAEGVGVEWRDDYAERVIPYVASDERVDRHGDIVRQNWNFDNFKMNPVMPYSHDWDSPPIGNVINWQVENINSEQYSGRALITYNLFAPEDVWAWADTIFRLVQSGFLKASSVGFYPLVILDVKDPDERSELGLGRWGWVYEESELVEHSPTTVPANAGAVSMLRGMKAKGELKEHDIQVIREFDRQKSVHAAHPDRSWREKDVKWRNVWGAVFPGVPIPDHKEVEVPLDLSLNDGAAIAELSRDVRSMLDQLGDVRRRLDEVEDMNTTVESIRDDMDVLQQQRNAPVETKTESPLSELLRSVTSKAEKTAAALNQGKDK